MGVVEFELVRVIDAPVEEVFDRIADIGGYADWMPKRGSLLRQTRQTSPGPVGLGTTYFDQTSAGDTPGDVAEFERPTAIVFHWWDASSRGTLKAEGWPGYRLQAIGPRATEVRHHARLQTYGASRLMTPVYRWLARRERTVVIEALKASFDRPT
ncbi:SRPBCC family protein [Microbacterium hydrocarbonoxydans]|uniref:SRPBCC family protein n=1 Tax=Microbacterium hydrocarbonoxydans TaxID=273678 RepID=UPI0013DBF3AE|nr:SRPBCC family protein [Microbacterium hydrocarbonoxydans]